MALNVSFRFSATISLLPNLFSTKIQKPKASAFEPHYFIICFLNLTDPLSRHIYFKVQYNTKAMKVSTVALSLVVTLAAIPGSVHGSEEYTWTEFSYEPYPFAYFVDDVDRYEACTPPPEAVNRHGELEYLGDTIYGTCGEMRRFRKSGICCP